MIVLIIPLASVVPIAVIAVFSYIATHRELTEFTMSRRQAIAYLAAATVKEKLDRLVDIGVSLATRIRFRQLVSEGKWEDAIEILQGIPKDFSFIDRVALFDRDGTLMADTPHLPGAGGKNFAFRDWYQGVSRSWKPYVSEVYRRAAAPQYNLTAVAVPIKAEDGIAGILLLQIRLESFLAWTKEINVGGSGFAYITDMKGRLVAHPRFSSQGEIVDFSSVPVVQKALRGEQGVGVFYNPVEKEERLAAYAPVPSYGWGVIIAEYSVAAFAPRDYQLRRVLFIDGLVLLLSGFLACLLLYTVRERRRADQEIRTLNRDLTHRATELEAVNKELESFSYSVSHDLRAPLRRMDGFSQALLEDYADKLDARARDYFHRIRNASQRMAQLIDDLLQLSRVSRSEMRRIPVDLTGMVRSIAADLAKGHVGREIEFQVAENVAVDGDPRLLELAMQNLLGNATKFTSKNRHAKVEFGVMRENGSSAYFVRDNGAGFEMAYVDKLFSPFQRLHGTNEFPGTGIGLATVQRIVHRHGGRVWAEAQPERGATFYFTLGGRGKDQTSQHQATEVREAL